MVRLIAPNGVAVEASEEAAPKLMENGFARAEKPKGKGATTRKRPAKQKE